MILSAKIPLSPPKQPFHITLLEKCLEHHKNDPERKAFIDSENGSTVGFDEIHSRALSFAAWLTSNGFRKGDIILLYLHNSWQFAVGCIGAWCAGLVVSAASPQFSQYELAYQLEDSGANLILTDQPCLPVVHSAVRKNPKPIICVSQTEIPGTVCFSTAINMKPISSPVEVDMFKDLIILPYSSGTTGNPKGVMITHLNYSYMLDSYLQKYRTEFRARGFDDMVPLEKDISFLPLYHAMGLFTMLFNLHNGTTQIIMAKFRLERFLQLIEEHQLMRVTVVPSILIQMVASPLLDKYDLSSLMVIGVGSAPLSQSVVDKLKMKLPDITFAQGYGMTETSVVSHIATLESPPGSIGPLMPGTQMKVISEEGKLCGPGEQGEMWIKGPQVMKGYWKKPKETAEVFDKDGFMRTGDVVYYDENGQTFICDRIKELIKVNAKQVPPAELESIILEMPGVTDCCVVGVPDDRFGEVPRAFVVSSQRDERAIQDHVNGKVAPYKRLRGGIVFVDVLPRTPTGKLLRRRLREDAKSKI